jgi:hypothetical protein
MSFPAYERYVALEKALKRHYEDEEFPASAQDRLDVALLSYRAMYAQGVAAWHDVPLVKVRRHLRHNHWQQVALGKGVLLLDALRRKLGEEKFVALMDDFGTANAGKEVTTAAFRAHVEKASGKKLGDFFAAWLEKPGLAGQPDKGGPYTVLSFYPEIEEAVIVYGTADDEAANREAAQALEAALRRRGANVEVPIKRDRDVSSDELKKCHLLLVGRPASNTITRRFQDSLPVTFGARSVKVRDQVYAHPDTAVLAAAVNPLNRRYSLVVIAGLEAASTAAAAVKFRDRGLPAGEVVILRSGLPPRARVVSAAKKP